MRGLPSLDPSSTKRSSQSMKLWASTLSTASARNCSSFRKMVIAVTTGGARAAILDRVDDGALNPLEQERSDQEQDCRLDHGRNQPERSNAAGSDQDPAQALDEGRQRVDDRNR